MPEPSNRRKGQRGVKSSRWICLAKNGSSTSAKLDKRLRCSENRTYLTAFTVDLAFDNRERDCLPKNFRACRKCQPEPGSGAC